MKTSIKRRMKIFNNTNGKLCRKIAKALRQLRHLEQTFVRNFPDAD